MEQVGKKDKLKKGEILAAVDFFRLGKILTYSLIQTGNINSNYILRVEKGKYILRVYKFKTKEEILCELELLNFLSKKNFPCPRPVGPILKIVNKYVCCFEFIEGREPSRITDVVLKRAGELMARFHKLTEKFNTGYKREGEGLEVIKKYIKNKKRIILASRFKDAGNFITYLETEISKILFSKNLPFGVVHIDVKKENLIAGRDEKLYFIDFDNFYFDSLVMDIANAVMWLCERGEKLDVRKAKIFLSAYDKIRKITALERENLKEAMKLYCLKGMFKYAYICLPRLKFAEKWAYHFVRTYKNISKQKINF